MHVDLATFLRCSVDEAVAQVNTPGLLQYVARPLVTFKPDDPPRFPSVWSEGIFRVRLKLFGFIPFGRQAVVVSYPTVQNGFAIRDNGHSALIKSWDHTITIVADRAGTLYRDEVWISAGVLTPLIWLFAQLYYRYRQIRWRRLASQGFKYDAP